MERKKRVLMFLLIFLLILSTILILTSLFKNPEKSVDINCRMYGIISDNLTDNWLYDQLVSSPDSLKNLSYSHGDTDGWGIGYYISYGDSINIKRGMIRAYNLSSNYAENVTYIESLDPKIVISHVRHCTTIYCCSHDSDSIDNPHPFTRTKNGLEWEFSHNGGISGSRADSLMDSGYLEANPPLCSGVCPDRNDSCDSEHYFLLVLNKIEDFGWDVEKGISNATSAMIDAGETGSMNFLLSDGQCIWGFKKGDSGHTLYYTYNITDSLNIWSAIASQPPNSSSGWIALNDRELVVLCPNQTPTVINTTNYNRTYYVATNGNDSNNGSVDYPFKTIQHAADTVTAGDTVIVKDGIYTNYTNHLGDLNCVYVTANGTSDEPITFKAEHKWGAVLDGQWSAMYGFWIEDHRYGIIVEGFEMRNFSRRAIYYGGSHGIIRQNKIHGTNLSSIIQAEEVAPYLEIDRNIFYDIGTHTYQDHGVYIESSNVNITNNIFYNITYGWPIHIYPSRFLKSNIRIEGNTFADQNADDGQILLDVNSSNITIKGNIFYNPRTCMINIYSSEGNCSDLKNVNITNNLGNISQVLNNYTCGDVNYSNNYVNTDPLFVNASARDYHLQASSPAINNITQSPLAYDFDNVSRPQGVAYDIGAYEYTNSDSAPVVYLNSPSNGYSTNLTYISFNCSATDDKKVQNISLYTNISSWSSINSTTCSSTSCTLNYNKTSIPLGAYKWNCLAYDNSSQSSWNTTNYTFIIYNSSSNCSDGTNYSQCSSTKPLYCNVSGSLINNCSACGCSSGSCQPDGSCKTGSGGGSGGGGSNQNNQSNQTNRTNNQYNNTNLTNPTIICNTGEKKCSEDKKTLLTCQNNAWVQQSCDLGCNSLNNECNLSLKEKIKANWPYFAIPVGVLLLTILSMIIIPKIRKPKVAPIIQSSKILDENKKPL